MKNNSYRQAVILLLPVLTIGITRIVLFFMWSSSQMSILKKDSWHHMYTGALFFSLAYFLPERVRPYVQAIGAGLFIDELVHLPHMLGLTNGANYWSRESYMWVIGGLAVYYLWKFWFYRKKAVDR